MRRRPKWNRSLVGIFNERKLVKAGTPPNFAKRDELALTRRIRFPNPLATLNILFDKEIGLVLFFAGMVYAGFYALVSSMPSQFKAIYNFSDLKIALMYLPIAGGSLVAAFSIGKLIDWAYFREARKLGVKVIKSRQQDLRNFPIEKARLVISFPALLVAATSMIGYGWILHFQTSIAGPCVMLFLMGYTLIGGTQAINILIVDVNPGLAGTATAAMNISRCLLGAGASAVIIPMVEKMGVGWAFTLIGAIYVLLAPILLLVIRCGPRWRREKAEKEEMKSGGGVIESGRENGGAERV